MNKKRFQLNSVNVTPLLRALKVCLEYGYDVEFTGVGKAPPGQQERIGFCSQIGVFHRLGGRNCCNLLFDDDAEDVFSYKLVSRLVMSGIMLA